MNTSGRYTPKTVNAAVDWLLEDMPLKSKAAVARMSKSELFNLRSTFGKYIKRQFDLGPENQELLDSCRFAAKDPLLDPDEADYVILKALWHKLRETHKLRIVK